MCGGGHLSHRLASMQSDPDFFFLARKGKKKKKNPEAGERKTVRRPILNSCGPNSIRVIIVYEMQNLILYIDDAVLGVSMHFQFGEVVVFSQGSVLGRLATRCVAVISKLPALTLHNHLIS